MGTNHVFGKRSEAALATCHPDLVAVARRALQLTTIDFGVTEGHRGEKAQEAAFAAGRSKLHFDKSKHNRMPSEALDVVPWPVNWSDARLFREIALAFKAAARELGIAIKWGGDFKTFVDPPHFELAKAGKISLPAPPSPSATQSTRAWDREDLRKLPPDELLARVIWGECRGVDAVEARAIAHVVLNRVRRPRGWGADVAAVCLHPRQFSCLNADDPNLEKILLGDFADGDWTTCQAEARDAVAGTSQDPTQNAIGYHATSMATYPAWAKNLTATCRIGGHVFYRERSK
jgi:peptidoglycan L-alanyl-D-glutamate endopeptidase CwlK